MSAFRAWLVMALVLLVGSPLAAADWWSELHCTSETGHPGGQHPPSEPMEGGGTQCHGKPGDAGTCAAADGSYSVTCWFGDLPNGMSEPGCSAQIQCPDGQGGTFLKTCFSGLTMAEGAQGFAGVMEIGGDPVPFFLCIDASGEEYPDYCGNVT